jgi:pentatricopeptide repeat protein
MAFTSLTAADIWRSIGLELIIFVVTLVFALIIRTSNGKKMAGKLGKGFQAASKTVDTSPPERSKVPLQNAGFENLRGAGGARINERSTFSERAQDRPQERRWAQNKDPAQIVDEVVDSMRDNPGTRTANRALALYADLQSTFKDLRINEAARRSNNSAVDFYTTLVQCAIRVGKHQQVEGLLDDMSRQNVPRSLPFYESTMKQLAGQKHYHLALNMYDRLVSDGLEASAITCSCLISFAAEVGELQRAIGFFDKLSTISTPSIRAYMTVLRVHAKRQDWPSSIKVFREMQSRRVKLDSLVLNVILATGVAADQIEGVEQLITEAESLKPPISDVVSYNTLIKGYAQRNDALKAIDVIARMHKRRLTSNAITYNTAMDAAVRSMKCQEAWDLLADMRKNGFRPDKFTCSILIKGLGKSPKSEFIQTGLDLMHEVDCTCDATLKSTLYHGILEAAASVPDTRMLMETFTQMRQHNVVLTAGAYRLLTQALGQDGDIKRCRQMLAECWQQMLKEEIRPQASIFVALLETHLRQGQVDGALQAFETLRNSIKGEQGNNRRIDNTALLEECRVAFIRSLCRISREPEATHTYLQARSDGALANIDSATGMMLARVQADSGNLSHAWMTLEDMIGLGHKPNEATLHSFLNACIKQSHTVYAKALLTKACENSISLPQATYALFLKLYGRCQQLQEALTVFEVMTGKQGIIPVPQTVVALLRVCFQCRQPTKAIEIMEALQEKTPNEALDGSIYKAAMGGCASAGLLPKGIAIAEDAAARGASLPSDALEVLVEAAQRRGSTGQAELSTLKDLADTLKVNFLPAPVLGNKAGASALADATLL